MEIQFTNGLIERHSKSHIKRVQKLINIAGWNIYEWWQFDLMSKIEYRRNR